ncbi:MAG: ABC transporter ATP-binding protein [Anaerolineae bacterium]|jgi:ATP-binding cassette subfamily B multidrug efflux pump
MSMRGGFMGRMRGQEESYRLSQLDRRALGLLWGYLRPYRAKLLLVLVALAVLTGTGLLGPYLTKVAIDSYIAVGDLAGLSLISLLYLLVGGLQWGASYWQGYLSSQVGQGIIHDLRSDLFDRVLRQSVRFHREEQVGQVMSRLTNDVNTLADAATSTFLGLITDVLSLGGVVVVLLLLNWRLALVTFVVMPVVVLTMALMGRRMRHAYRDVQQELAAVSAGVEQGVSGMRVTQSLSAESYSVEQFEDLSLRNLRANLRASLLTAALSPTMSITGSLGTALVLGYGGVQVATGAITVGVLMAALGYVRRFFGPLRELSLVYNTLQGAAASLDRVSDYLDRPVEVEEPEHPQRPAGGFVGRVDVDHVSFSYGREKVLEDVSLTIEPGEVAALVGPTGAGKSTLVNLVTRLYDVQEGRVALDGVDIRDIAFADLRRLIAVVPQDTFLFDGSIGDNIRYARREATDAEVEAAARQAQAHEFISRLPQGYETQVGEGGVRLSGGQKQLVALARAMLADPTILILDEATSHVDAHTEGLIQAGMEELLRGRTALIIAHRFSTLKRADRIYVMEAGRVVAQGTHEQLLEISPTYRDLAQKQWVGSDT